MYCYYSFCEGNGVGDETKESSYNNPAEIQGLATEQRKWIEPGRWMRQCPDGSMEELDKSFERIRRTEDDVSRFCPEQLGGWNFHELRLRKETDRQHQVLLKGRNVLDELAEVVVGGDGSPRERRNLVN